MEKNGTIAGWLMLLGLATLSLQPPTALAQTTAFTYQGQLNADGRTATGIYDLRFTIYDSTNSPGIVIAGPLTNSATGVTSGLFTVTLDFGAGVFTGPARWLELDVRTNGSGAFTPLLPRQALLPAPYAMMADTASNLLGTLPAAQLSGTLPASALAGYAGAVMLTNGGNSFNGSFTGSFNGNGGGLTNLNGAKIQPGSVSSNALDAPTAAQLALAGQGGGGVTGGATLTNVNLVGTDSPVYAPEPFTNSAGDAIDFWVTGNGNANLNGHYLLQSSNYVSVAARGREGSMTNTYPIYVLNNGTYWLTNAQEYPAYNSNAIYAGAALQFNDVKSSFAAAIPNWPGSSIVYDTAPNGTIWMGTNNWVLGTNSPPVIRNYAFIGNGAGLMNVADKSGVVINILSCGAKGIPADDTLAFGLAITNVSTAGGGTVIVPAGDYMVSNIYVLDNVLLSGSAGHSTITMKPLATGFMISTYAHTNWGIENLALVGGAHSSDGSGFTTTYAWPDIYNDTYLTSGSGARNGLLIYTPGNQFIKNVVADGFTNGFYGIGPGSGLLTPGQPAASVQNCFAEECYVGWNFSTYDPFQYSSGGTFYSTYPEFVRFFNIGAFHCAYGGWFTAGNNVVVGGQFNMNQIGVTMQIGANSGHGKFIGCDFNHGNGQWGLWADAISYGEMFYGCSFMGGNNGIKLTGCTGFRFDGCFLDTFSSGSMPISASRYDVRGDPPDNEGTAVNEIANSYIYGSASGILLTNDGSLSIVNVRSFWHSNDFLMSGVSRATFSTTNAPSAGQVLKYDGTNAYWSN